MKTTVWQVRVQDEWRYAEPSVAAMVAEVRPGNVRLASLPIPKSIAFDRYNKHSLKHRPSGPSKRRLAAARRALKSQRDKAPLFAEQIAVTQPSPEERIARIDAACVQIDKDQRSNRAKHWIECRRRLRTLPADVQARILFKWSVAYCPKVPEYFVDYIIRAEKGESP